MNKNYKRINKGVKTVQYEVKKYFSNIVGESCGYTPYHPPPTHPAPTIKLRVNIFVNCLA